MTNSIKLLDGKYTFVITDKYQVEILRYGDPWREFGVGDKAMYALVVHAIELEAENAKLKQALQEIVELDASIVDCDCCRIASAALEGK